MRGIDRPPAEEYDVAVLDLDGVIYIGHEPVPGAAEALAKARAAGMRLAFATNNASRTPAATAALITEVGVPATAGDVVTSAQAAARLLADRLPAGSKVLVVGGTGLRHALRGVGLRPVSTAADRPAAVVQGFAPGISYDLMAEGGRAVADGALFVASNADTTMPSACRPSGQGITSRSRTSSAVRCRPVPGSWILIRSARLTWRAHSCSIAGSSKHEMASSASTSTLGGPHEPWVSFMTGPPACALSLRPSVLPRPP